VIGTVSREGVKTVNGKELTNGDGDKEGPSKVTGTIEFQQKAEFGPDTIATVELEDTSRADAKVSPVATQKIKGLKQFPIPFELSYDPQAIKPSSRYSLRARITTKQRLDYTNDASVPVLTAGNPSKDVKIPVVRVKR
jgi:putative lipoprotein